MNAFMKLMVHGLFGHLPSTPYPPEHTHDGKRRVPREWRG
jgi:hypothetical protein